MPIFAFLLAVLLVMCGAAKAQDARSSNLNLLLMGNGLHSSDWGTQTNTNLEMIDSAISGQTALSIGGGSLALTQAQTMVNLISFTGTLTSNQTVAFPTLPNGRVFNVANFTNGGYSLTIQSIGGGSSVAVAQGAAVQIYVDNANAAVAGNSDPAVPVGTIWHYAGSSAPYSKWLMADGSALSRTTYASLYAAIGTTYGAGDGSTTFNIPDCRGNVLAGPDGGTGRLGPLWVAGYMAGAASQTISIAQMPAHNHTATDSGHAHGVSDPGHSHTYMNTTPNAGGGFGYANGSYPLHFNIATSDSVSYTGISVNTGYANISVGSTGGGAPLVTVQPTLAVNCIVRVN